LLVGELTGLLLLELHNGADISVDEIDEDRELKGLMFGVVPDPNGDPFHSLLFPWGIGVVGGRAGGDGVFVFCSVRVEVNQWGGGGDVIADPLTKEHRGEKEWGRT